METVFKSFRWCLFLLIAAASLVPNHARGQATLEPIPSSKPEISPAEADSILWAEFNLLSPDEQEDRTAAAEELREDAKDLSHGPRRVEKLRQAVDLAPTHPVGWVDLAEVLRWMGYRQEATRALDTALFMVKKTSGSDKKKCALEYSLARAWLDYEQGDWSDGHDRAKRAVKLGGGLRAQLIAGLNRAGTEIKDKEMRESLRVFYPLDTNTNRRRNFWWAYLTWRHLHNNPYEPPDAWGYKEDSFKIPDHEGLRWRDRALREEANDVGNLALRAYGKSAQYHPVPQGSWMRKLSGEIPGAAHGFPAMPFWLNPQGDYVTGSLLAYQAYCHDRMKKGIDATERARWAHKVVWAGNAALNRYPYRPWTRLWRGEAFLELDLFQEAENDITYARSWFDEFEIDEPALLPPEGHVFLLGKNYNDALPVLERAAVAFPENAGVWADLGLVRIKKKGRAPAREAFERALELDPSLAVAWHNRGLVNLQDRRFAEALADLEKAAELAPHDPQVQADLARINQIMAHHDRQ